MKNVFQDTRLSSDKRRERTKESGRGEIREITKGTRKRQNSGTHNANAATSGIKKHTKLHKLAIYR
jgi:hypothetical protein